ncbi:PSD1 and planctomycete cytochrome C domain-containing protein [Aeoliella sp. ICT_H6.2]|uniref:PSD1 and planctomycete cytochrome C domain-containing protein n=1 Tax=Aeoliella straminimaris TaxID=2954799 RepID=A0A9X2FEK1_9BACT|nr:PSD1 and planctomycete cytochrome C domain-containing protein [Aeoliella straminimaris]MCO6047702.1 PSD1 and planctomycete cytochrome C domain-containing protein [Aeoliella straminimaris]
MNRPQKLVAVAMALVPLLVQPATAEEGVDFFEQHIRPVLADSCYGCHSQADSTTEGELALDNRASVLRGGRGGAIIVPGKPDASRLLKAIEHSDAALQMPPGEKLPDEVIAAFREWIAMGAPDPRDGAAPELDTIASRAADHWAFQKPVRPEVPEDSTGWSRNDVDRLIVDKLSEAGLAPSPQASKRTLIERLYFDLVGLAPTQEQIEHFVADSDPEAYSKLVDRLLASPQFGERWARHWLDLARFADTKGYVFTEDRNFPHAYKYRDWVINALNDDMPINRFMMYQLAADLMGDSPDDQQHLAAQGYVTLGRRFVNNRPDIAADRIDVVFRGMMGLSVACARCHDHKYDPVSDEDYYALYGILESSREEQDDTYPLRLVDKDKPENVGVFIRGATHNRGPIVERGFPEFFSSFAPEVEAGSGRLELAEAIVHPENPLTARVFVNRVWGHLFGEQLVSTPSDFGLRCDAPRQQQVLDLLAVDLQSSGWSLKQLVRQLVMSSTYQQSSNPSDELLAADAENALWGRANRRRLDFESLRDRLLKVAGQLDTRVGGESENIVAGNGGSRRTLYAHIDRQNLPNVFRTFDFASPDAHSPERAHTLVPQQALFLMNGALAERVATALSSSTAGAASDRQRVEQLYQRILARQPTEGELELARQFIARQMPETLPPDEWSYGFGRIDAGYVQFEPLPHFMENRWQAKGNFPADQQFGYVSVSPTGGHPGQSPEMSSIRRWTAPREGTLVIEGELHRPEQQGDGVDGLIVSSHQGIVGQWTVEHGTQSTPVRLETVAPGEHIDFVVACRQNDAYDSYQWRATVTLETTGDRQTWHTEQGFHGPAAEPLDLWSQLAQVLLMSNEFLYVD